MLLKRIKEGERKKLIKTKIVLIKLYLLSLIPEFKLLAILLIILATKKDTYPGIRGALNIQIRLKITPKKLKLKKMLLLQIVV